MGTASVIACLFVMISYFIQKTPPFFFYIIQALNSVNFTYAVHHLLAETLAKSIKDDKTAVYNQ
jgi:hypothetical protein